MSKQILLADDSAATKTGVENALGPDEYQVSTAENGRAAMDQINQELPHLVLAHAMLPEVDGYEICRQIKGNPDTSHIPVLLLTGTFEPFDINRAKEVRYDGFVTKPPDPNELKSLINRCIANAVYPAVEPEPSEAVADTADVSEFPGSTTEGSPDRGSDAMLDRIFPDDQPLEQVVTGDRESDDLFSIVDPVVESEEPVTDTGFETPAVEPLEDDAPTGDTVDRSSPDFGIWGTDVAAEKDVVEVAAEVPVTEEPAPFTEDSDLSWFLKKYEEKNEDDEGSGTGESEKEPADAEEESSAPVFSPPPESDPVAEVPLETVESVVETDPLLDAVEPLPTVAEEETAPRDAGAQLVLDEQQLEQISRRVVELLSETVVRDVAWEAVPEIAERVIRERLREIEAEADTPT